MDFTLRLSGASRTKLVKGIVLRVAGRCFVENFPKLVKVIASLLHRVHTSEFSDCNFGLS